MQTKLFIPGPVNLSPEMLKVRANHVPYGHRTPEVGKRLKPIFENLKKLFFIHTEPYEIIVSTSSGTGMMEGAIRNCVRDEEKVLMVSIGAFGDLWHTVARGNGKQAELLSFPPGEPADAKVIEEKLKTGEFSALCVTHCETSTGVINSLPEISQVVKKYNVLFLVDAVSSLAGIPIKVEEWGIDVILASSQKCLGLDAGLAVGAVSPRALEKAAQIPNRGYYFDFLEFKKLGEKGQTPTTPNEVVIDELHHQLDYILNIEGLENRFQRHKRLAETTRKWATAQGFELFPKRNFSDTVICIRNTRGIDLAGVREKMLEKGYVFDAGYRKLNDLLKGKGEPTTFRIAVMGDLTLEQLQEYLNHLEEAMR